MNLARHLKIDAESALRRANAKFRSRFSAMERASGTPLETMSAEDLERLWSQAKFAESGQ
jgi:XTP/dITP diphosphohydrolase/ATP diphosphatase